VWRVKQRKRYSVAATMKLVMDLDAVHERSVGLDSRRVGSVLLL
jgi:hypothetical protein